MHILQYFEQQQIYTFDELKEITNLDSTILEQLLQIQVKKKRLLKRRDFYELRPIFKIGMLDLKENFGFLLQEERDLYIDKINFKDALDKDIALVRAGETNKVIEVLKRNTHKMVCSVKKTKTKTLIIPNQILRLPIEIKDTKSLLDGEVIYVRFIDYKEHFIEAEVIEVIGHITDPDIDVLKIVYSFGFPYNFLDETIKEAEQLDSEVDLNSRLIVKDELIITIDGADAKDLDDAISLKFINNKYHLSVHIADVSHYVKENSYIDKNAFEKATSLYLADRVIPMLPRRLSNDLCSLNVGQPKYALSVFIVLDELGNVLSHEIKETIITVDKRFSYDEVNEILNDNNNNNDLFTKMLKEMYNLSVLLQNKRTQRGALDFVSEEYEYILDEQNNIKDIVLRTSGSSEQIIESFMILTNEVVGEHLTHLQLPSIYRVHPKPKLEKIQHLFVELEKFNIRKPRHQNITSKTLQIILKEVEESPLKMAIHELMLRSMNKAKYEMNNVGHFGLASRYYSHFTAPIRRYPDLLLHRLVKEFLIHPNNLNKKIKYYESVIPDIASHSSEMEKLAETIEREVDKLKIAEFMMANVGKKYEGVISGFINAGFFVRIDKGIEGFVPFRLTDQISYNSDKGYIRKNKGNKVLKLGSIIKVRLYEVNKDLRQITFKFIE